MAVTGPSILLLHPSCFYVPVEGPQVEIKTPLQLLAAYLKPFYPVRYEDFEASIGRPCSPLQIRRYERRIREYFEHCPYDILAISCWTSLSFTAALACARVFRELHPDRLIVVGGYHPSARPGDFQTADHLFDYVVVGEGELALREIAERYRNAGRPPETVMVKGESLAPEEFVGHDWDVVADSLTQYHQRGVTNVYLFLSRGCPFDCSFCMESLKTGRWRAYTPERAMEEVAVSVQRQAPAAVAISDACFGMRPSWRKEFLRRLVDSSPRYWVALETRAEYLDDEDMEMLARLPKLEIQFGLESAAPGILRLMRKTKQPERYLDQFRRVSRRLNEHGILHRANMIHNHPGETRETLAETFAFVDEMLAEQGSYLLWAHYGFMDFPGCEIDRNRAFYETTFGSRFEGGDWWREEADQMEASFRSIPSRDLDGDRVDEWQRLVKARDGRFRDCLAPRAFAFNAWKYNPEWQDDPRWAQHKATLAVR